MNGSDTQSIPAVLVVDDEAGIRQGCRRVLEPRGFLVETAATCEEGLQRINSGRFDIILLDVMLPDGRGIDLLEPIHAVDPEIIPIIITGYATVELAVQAIKAGAYDFIAKPFTPDLLLITINQGLERRRLSLAVQRVAVMEQERAQLARAKEEAEQLAEFKTAFTLKVAHELRTPVASAISLIRPLMRGLAGELSQDQQDILTRIDNRLDMLMELVNDLLSLAATRAVVAEEPLQPVQVQPILAQAVERQESQAAAKRLALHVDSPEQPLAVMAAAKGLDTIISNLLSNAIKYTPAGGQVAITLSESNGQVHIAVNDTGIGIPAADLDRLGEEFFRAKNAKQTTTIGTGLGLSIVKELLQTYGGTLAFHSEEGRGTTADLLLPAAPSA